MDEECNCGYFKYECDCCSKGKKICPMCGGVK